MKFHHIAFKVSTLTDVLEHFQKLGATIESHQNYSEVDLEMAVILQGGLRIELIRPLSEKSPVWTSANGFHHIAFEVSNIEENYQLIINDDKINIIRHINKCAFNHSCFFYTFNSSSNFMLEILG